MDFRDEMFYPSEKKDLDTEVEKLFQFYRKTGYPDYSKDEYDIHAEFRKLLELDERQLLKGKNIIQNPIGLGVLWTYHPHWKEILCAGQKRSILDAWNDDDALRKLIRKTYVWKLKHESSPHWTQNRIRQQSKVYLVGQSVSNFRPSVAKLIYNLYGNKGDVLDMSSGFGGRMFGFFASDCESYTGIEPSEKTYAGLMELKADLEKLDSEGLFPRNRKAVVHKTGSEIYHPEWDGKFDLCFTSPPYFDTEKYSDEETQSWKKYSTLDYWLEGFLKSTIENCWKYTKPEGRLIINIADTTKHKGIEDATVHYAVDCGFHHTDTLHMELSSISGKGRKTEPVFIFEKP